MKDPIQESFEKLMQECNELVARIQYLVDNWPGGCEDGGFTFPDGAFWPTSKKENK